ncbi:MAG: hypothetical protein ACKO6Q_09995 [Bacteroidota bacterium]
MLRRIGLWGLFLTAAIGCQKDKYTTVPQVTIESISPAIASSGSVIQVNGKYTDLEGDIDSALIVYKWYNGSTAVRKDTFRYGFVQLGIPAGVQRAELNLKFEYNTNNYPELTKLPGVSQRDTTAAFGLLLIDKAKNRSNYTESPTIRLKKP